MVSNSCKEYRIWGVREGVIEKKDEECKKVQEYVGIGV